MQVSVFGLRGFPNVEGGVEKHCERLYPKIDKDINIRVYRRKPYVENNTTSCFQSNISFVDLVSTKIKGFETIYHSYLSTKKAIKDNSDVVHIHNIGPALFCNKFKNKKKVVLTYHSPNYEHSKWGMIGKRVLMFAEKRALKYADAIIFVNKFQLEKYPIEIQKKSFYIPNGVCKPNYVKSGRLLDSIRVKPKKYILGVGRITPEKGFDVLIKAFIESGLKENGYSLVIAGGTQYEPSYYEALKKMSDSVVFTGSLKDTELNELYSNASLYVLSSNNEGFPLALLEALSYKNDVAVVDIPATHLVTLNEDDYFEKGNYHQLSTLMVNKINKNVEREYDLSEFDWDIIAKKVSDIYRGVINENIVNK